MSELKPCPFCGGKALRHVAFASGGDHSVGVYVECLECRSWSGTKWGDGAQEKAADVWNRRAERTCRNLNPPSCRDFECSECGESSEFTPGFMPNYCPHCGARVIEEGV